MSILGFDHFIILVNDLTAAMETYRTLGFEVRAGGEHPSFGSHNALVAFGDGTYLELLAFNDAARATQSFWRDGVKMLAVKQGFGGFVLASNDLAGDVTQLRAQKLDIADPSAGSRMRPDGQVVEWQTALIGGMPSGALPFLIQDVTPRELRVQAAKEGFGETARVKEVVVAVKHADLTPRCVPHAARRRAAPRPQQHRRCDGLSIYASMGDADCGAAGGRWQCDG